MISLRFTVSFYINIVYSTKVFLINTLNDTAELNWPSYHSDGADGWVEETLVVPDRTANQQVFSTCHARPSARYENWLLVPRVRRGGAERVHVDVTYTLRHCDELPRAGARCAESLQVWARGVAADESVSALDWHNSSGWSLVQTLPATDARRPVVTATGVFVTDRPAVYFALKDTGACASLMAIQVYYVACPAGVHQYARVPETLPATEMKPVPGVCIHPQRTTGQPHLLCQWDGTWHSLINSCGCHAGFGGEDGLKCIGSKSACYSCPPGSTSQMQASSCDCLPNHSRPNASDSAQACLPPNRLSRTAQYDSAAQEGRTGSSLAALIALPLLVLLLLIVAFLQYRRRSGGAGHSHSIINKTFEDDAHNKSAGLMPPGTPVSNKSCVTLLPAFVSRPRLSARSGTQQYVDPTTYDDLSKAVADLTNEIGRERVEVTCTIGAGHFGEVCCARLRVDTLLPLGMKQIVAVKMLRPGVSEKAQQNFLTEAMIMGQFEHPNVIRLIGVVTRSQPIMIVTEYMLNGSLDRFLRNNDNGLLGVSQLVRMMNDIARGMKYLTDTGFFHRDLAARNVLVDDQLTCKIADFGLSRGLGPEEDDYTAQEGAIPVRWSAPESIAHRRYNQASDVWAFGVVMWEVMSFGERPYWDWTNAKVVEEVRNGFRLPRPASTPRKVHDMMVRCWSHDRHHRPTFDQLCRDLAALQREVADYVNQSMDRSFCSLPPDTPTSITSDALFVDT